MLISQLVTGINNKLAGERCSPAKLAGHIDSAIDDINTKLNSTFPVYTELPAGATEYNAFPDRYLRTVVMNGAAYYFYQTDEEGIDSATAYKMKFDENLFYMLRDYGQSVPLEYQAPDTNGVLNFELTGSWAGQKDEANEDSVAGPGIDLDSMRI